MNIPPKYEDVVAQLDAALGREAALREELATIRADRDAEKEMKAKARDQRDVQTIRACELQQRLTVAEQRAGELEGLLHMSKELLTTISRHGASTMPVDWCDSFKAEVADRIEKIGAALKPAAEEYTSPLQHAGNLSTFAKEVIYGALEGGSFDGADIQEIAVNHGLLKIETRTEECGEVCACREYGFPSECYRKSDLLELKPAAECEHSFHYFGTEQKRRRCNSCNKLEAAEGEGS